MAVRRLQPIAVGLAAILLLLGSGLACAVSRGVRGTTNVNVNRSANSSINATRSVNVNRDINVNRDVNIGVDPGYGHGELEHPVAAAVVVGSAVAAAAVAIGTVTDVPPPACEETDVGGMTYLNCNGTWYQPRFDGYQVEYVVVTPPN